METKNSADLSEIINNIRMQYERAAQKSQEETEAWYQNKVRRREPHVLHPLLPSISWRLSCLSPKCLFIQFDNIAAEVTQNTEALQTGRTELNELRRQKQALEIDLQTLHNMVHTLPKSSHFIKPAQK